MVWVWELRRCGCCGGRSPGAAAAGPSDVDHVAKRDIDLMVRMGPGFVGRVWMGGCDGEGVWAIVTRAHGGVSGGSRQSGRGGEGR